MAVEILNKTECCGCAVCGDVCPKGCITMLIDREGFAYPSVDKAKCIGCNLCEKVCPIKNNPNAEIENESSFYAARSADSNTREKSSSGAVAYLLAKEFLEKGGVVCGVKMSDDFSRAEHVCVDNINELHLLSGSKYIQSDTSGIYRLVERFTKAGKKVLFIGTPCQVAAAKNYFSKKDSDITYVDIICHGVPSQTLWDKYREYVKFKYKGEITKVNFRDKHMGWEAYGLSASFDNGKSIYVPRRSGYLGLFLANVCLRPVCGTCHHKGFNRCSDITLGDFWGIERVMPDYDKKNGVSIAMVNSTKGLELLQSLGAELELTAVDCKDLFAYRNKSLLRSVRISDRRDEFMNDLERLSIPQLENKYLGNQFVASIKGKVKRLIGK